MKIKREKFKKETKTFTFDVTVREFLVKNCTDDNLIVCFGKTYNSNNGIMILSNCNQIITENLREDTSEYMYDSVTIHCDGEGEVEVQCLEY